MIPIYIKIFYIQYEYNRMYFLTIRGYEPRDSGIWNLVNESSCDLQLSS